jgi:hypothetical protein
MWVTEGRNKRERNEMEDEKERSGTPADMPVF